MKLNLGAGNFPLKGFINIDKKKLPGIDRILEIKDKLDYPDGSIDEIYMGHFIEHLEVDDAVNLLKDCLRVLKKEGKIIITIPDFEKIFQQFNFSTANKMIMNRNIPEEINPSKIEEHHKSLWTNYYLEDILRKLNFKDVITLEDCPYLTAKVNWQSIIEAKK